MNEYTIITDSGDEYTIEAHRLIYYDQDIVLLLCDGDKDTVGILSLTNVCTIKNGDGDIGYTQEIDKK